MGSVFKILSKKKRAAWIVVFIVSIMYSVSSMNVLILTTSALPYIEGLRLVTRALILFAVISFGLAIFLSVYHLYTMLRTEKRKNIIQKEIKQ